MACLFTFLSGSFQEQKFLILMQTKLTFLKSVAFHVISKKSSPNPMWFFFLFLLIFKIILSFTFSLMVHFDLFFVYGMKCRLKFTFMHIPIQLFHHHVVKDYSFSSKLLLRFYQWLLVFVYVYLWTLFCCTCLLILKSVPHSNVYCSLNS